MHAELISLWSILVVIVRGVWQAATVEFARCPLIANPPSLVMDSSRLTLLDLGRRAFLPSSDLPPACQVCPGLSRSCPARILNSE